MEAEFIAANECTKELKYLIELLKELTGKQVTATLHIDNQSTVKIIKAGRMKKSRHIEVKFFFVKDEYYKKLFNMIDIPSENNISDISTKPLCSAKFDRFAKELMF